MLASHLLHCKIKELTMTRALDIINQSLYNESMNREVAAMKLI